jgi:GNAT superfamily N-acetyltransferase
MPKDAFLEIQNLREAIDFLLWRNIDLSFAYSSLSSGTLLIPPHRAFPRNNHVFSHTERRLDSMSTEMITKLRLSFFSKFDYLFHEYLLENLHWPYQDFTEATFHEYAITDYIELQRALRDSDTDQFFLIEQVNQRVQDGHHLYIAKSNAEVIGFFWVMVGTFGIDFLHSSFALRPDEALSLNGYIHKAYRGKRIMSALKAFAFDRLRRKGYKRVIGFYNLTNEASARMNRRFGSRPIGVLTYISFLSLTFRWHTIPDLKIIFNDGPLVLWKNLFRAFLSSKSNNSDDTLTITT